jgi:hypothetical protein
MTAQVEITCSMQASVAVEILRYFNCKRNENYAEEFILSRICYPLANKVVIFLHYQHLNFLDVRGPQHQCRPPLNPR